MDFLLVFLMSMDSLLTCFSLGTKRISISLGARLVIAFVGTGCLILSFLFAQILSLILPESIFHFISSFSLVMIALFCLLDKSFLNPDTADIDHSGVLSPVEALFLAVPLSLDSLFTGLSVNTNVVLIIFCFICGFTASFIGQKLGEKFANSQGKKASFCSGCMLLMIAGFKMLFG